MWLPLGSGKTRTMDTAVTIAQIASPIVNLMFVIVLGAGYYFLFRTSKEQLQEMREEFTSGGRPQVIVDDDYGSLPQVNVVVRNVRGDPPRRSPSSSRRPWRAPMVTSSPACPTSKTG